MVIARNLSAFRKARGLTQAELAERINYSDKVISKWERGESTPDVVVLNRLAQFYGVTVDRFLREGDAPPPVKAPEETPPHAQTGMTHNHRLILIISCLGVWFLAALAFAVVWGVTRPHAALWQIFVCALPVTAVVCLVLNSLWGRRRNNLYILSALIWSALLAAFLMLPGRMWPLFLLSVPGQLAAVLAFRFRRAEKPR